MTNQKLASVPGVRAFGLTLIDTSYAETAPHKDAFVTTAWKTDKAVPQGASLLVQVFHTDVDRLTSRQHMLPIDRDDRRPIFALNFGDVPKAMQWLNKNFHLLLAAEVTMMFKSEKETLIITSFIGNDQEILQLFVAWAMHVTGRQRPKWCTAHVSEHGDGVAAVRCEGLLTSDDFNAVLNDKKKLEDCSLVPGDASRDVPTLAFEKVTGDQLVELTRELYEREVRHASRSTQQG